YTVVFVERERVFRGADFLRVYLVRGIMTLKVQQRDLAAVVTQVTTLEFDQADGFAVSGPSANLARVNLSTMTGPTSGGAGKKGAVPAPAAGQQGLFLRGDATWAAPGGSIEVKMSGGSPDYTGVSVLVISGQDGVLSLGQPQAGQAQLNIAPAGALQAGYVSTGTQTFAGYKNLPAGCHPQLIDLDDHCN